MPDGKSNATDQLQQAQHFQYEAQAKQDLHAKEAQNKALKLLFIVIFVTNLIINLDHGILPACTAEVRDSLDIDSADLGLLGSIVYLGLVIGSLFAMPIFNYCNTKFVLIVCLLLNSGFLMLFTYAQQYWLLISCRLLVGVFQVFFCIYFPVWVDLFNDDKKKTLLLTLLLMGVPLGIILGYIMTAVIVQFLDWRWAFYIQSLFIIPLAVCFLVTPARYIVYSHHHDDNYRAGADSLSFIGSSDVSRKESQVTVGAKLKRQDTPEFLKSGEKQEVQAQSHRDRTQTADSTVFKNHSFKNTSRHTPNQGSGYDAGSLKRQKSVTPPLTKYQRRKLQEQRRLNRITGNYSLCEKIMYLLTHLQFMILLLALTAIYFITTGIQFWMTDYWVTVLGRDKAQGIVTLAAVTITGPIIGVLCGGYIFNHLGGYTSPRSYPVAAFVMFLGGALGFPIPFVESNVILMIGLLWGQFFCGGFCMPVLTGILLNSVPIPLRTVANSIANLFYNLFGYLPSPYVYGLAYQLTGSGKSRWGLIALEIAGLVGSFLLIVLLIKLKFEEWKETRKYEKVISDTQGGAASALLADDDQIGPYQKHPQLFINDDQMASRGKKQTDGSRQTSQNDYDDEDEIEYFQMHRISHRTSISDKIMMETSLLQTKCMYPMSLGINNERNDEDDEESEDERY